MSIPTSYLPPSSQPWGRWVTNSIRQLFAKRDEFNLSTANSIKQLNTAIREPMRGLLWKQLNTNVTITTQGVYVPINSVGTLDDDVTFNMASGIVNATGLRNTTDQTRTVLIQASFDGRGANNDTLGLQLALNGELILGSICSAFCGSSAGPINQLAKTFTHWIVKLEPGDEVSMWCANLSSTTNLALARWKMSATAIA